MNLRIITGLVRNLIYTATVVPYNVSFPIQTTTTLSVVEYISDGIWIIDLILTFFCAYEDKMENLITDRKKIILNYLLGWFIIDFISVFPFDLVFNMDKGVNNLIRIAKLPKLTRFLRLAKYVEMRALIKFK